LGELKSFKIDSAKSFNDESVVKVEEEEVVLKDEEVGGGSVAILHSKRISSYLRVKKSH